MEKYSPQKDNKTKKREDKNFILSRAASMEPFKIEIYSEEFLDIVADVIGNPNTKYNAIDDMVDDIHKPIEMKIDSDVYREMLSVGEKNDVELVCKYIAVQRILTCSSNSKFVGMIKRVRETLKSVPVTVRHVITSETYRKMFAVIPAAYLCSVCNLDGVGREIAQMDKGVVKTMTAVMEELKRLTEVDDKVVGDGYSAVVDVVDRLMVAYHDHNIIDLGNLVKIMHQMFDGKYGEYFEKLLNKIDSDISDSFAKFDKLVLTVKDADEKEFIDDRPDPVEYDPIPSEEMDAAMGVETPIDLENDSVLGPNDNNTGVVNTGLEEPATDMNAVNNPTNAGVVTGLESVMTESMFKKKLKRISRESIGYVKVRGSNARDADELAMIVSYGYYVAEKCEWYMDIIQREDDRYIVPQSYAELDSIRKEMYRVLDELMRDPIFRSRGSVYKTRGIELF